MVIRRWILLGLYVIVTLQAPADWYGGRLLTSLLGELRLTPNPSSIVVANVPSHFGILGYAGSVAGELS